MNSNPSEDQNELLRKVWLHVHVPKAGGSTLRQLMNRNFGEGYYCNTVLEMCATPVCGQMGCEPGEDESNCCRDCDECNRGEYCRTAEVADGVCTEPVCGNGEQEEGEDLGNCCSDFGGTEECRKIEGQEESGKS